MTDVVNLARKNIRNLKPHLHGGNVWAISRKLQIPINKIVDFSVSTNPMGPPSKVLQAIRKNSWLIDNYPDPDPKELKDILANQVGNVKAENIIVGNGSVELIYRFAEAFLDAGCASTIPEPTFGEYEMATLIAGGKPQFVKYHLFNKPYLTVKDVTESVNNKTRLIFLCNPNSPTGTMLPKKETIEIISFAEKHNILVLLDENYVDFVDAQKTYSMADHIAEFSNLFVLKSLTKFFSMVGIRIGFGVASEELITILDRSRMPWNVNNLAMLAAKEAVMDKEYMKKSKLFISKERAYLTRQLQRIEWLKVHPSDANFFLIKIKLDKLTSTQLKDKLILDGVLIRDCANFRGLNNKFFRVSVRKRMDNKRLLKLLKEIAV